MKNIKASMTFMKYKCKIMIRLDEKYGLNHLIMLNCKIYFNKNHQLKIFNPNNSLILKKLIKILIYSKTQKYKNNHKKHI